eukprot:COSAG06_NODE_13805_length_1217_cov_1.546512_2_plen_158_part_00
MPHVWTDTEIACAVLVRVDYFPSPPLSYDMTQAMRLSVRGMLPRNKLRDRLMKQRLLLYAVSSHCRAQQRLPIHPLRCLRTPQVHRCLRRPLILSPGVRACVLRAAGGGARGVQRFTAAASATVAPRASSKQVVSLNAQRIVYQIDLHYRTNRMTSN